MVKSKLLRPLFLLLLLASFSAAQDAELKSYFGSAFSKDALDDYLAIKMEELNIPGLSVAIINDGQVVHHKTMGYANLEQMLPVTGKTIFEGASMSKSVFAFFVMKYVEEGKLDLDKPLFEYLPYPDIAHDERYKKITARMVLCHRSGFPNWRYMGKDGKLKIKFEPGTDYEYSGEGYQYLAMVLREMEGAGWAGLEAAFQEKVAKPLGIKHTVFIQTPYTKEHKAEPYDENGMRLEQTENLEFGAAYSIHSEPIDFSKWMIAVMNQELLTEESYRELFTSHSNMPSDGIVDLSYTLGFVKPDFPIIDTDFYLHTGNNEGFTCWYVLDIKKNWGFVLFTNSEYGEQLGNDLFIYLFTGPDLTKFYIIAGVVALFILLGIGYAIKTVINKLKSARPDWELFMTPKRWFYLFLLWQLGGVAATTVFSISAGSFHNFTHELVLCLSFTNLIGLGITAIVALHQLKLKQSFNRGVRILIVAPLVAVVLYFGTDFALNIGAKVCGTDHYEVGQWHLAAIIINFVTLVVATIFCILLMLYRRIASNLEKKIHENTELSRLQLETKFALLQSKVNPHFLFNTLNTMLDVLRTEPKKVERMILNLSDIYHKTLTLPDRSLVSLEEELELVKEYLEIEKIRMGDRLEYRFHVKEHLRQTKIPPMMVQILVENAIRHGLAPKKDGGEIEIKVDELENKKLVVAVKDTGVGIKQKPTYSGYGLTCIKQQLKLLYDTSAQMQIALIPTGGTNVRIELPAD